MGTILLVRHGETAWNRDRRVQGWAGTALTDRGREQADALAAHLADARDVDRIEASDLRRARETARVIARRLDGAPVRFDRGWRERGFGVLEGLTYEALFDGHPEYALSAVGDPALEARPEGGESLLDARERVLSALDALAADLGREETALVVTHGGPVRLVVADLRGLDLVSAVTDLEVPNCSVTEVGVEAGTDGGPRTTLVSECGQVLEPDVSTGGASLGLY